MATRTITVFSQTKLAHEDVYWPEGDSDERKQLEALGYSHLSDYQTNIPVAPQKKAFTVFARYPDGMVPNRTATSTPSWAERYIYVLLPYVGHNRQGDLISVDNLDGVERYMRSQLDPSWDSSNTRRLIPLNYFLWLNAPVEVNQPGEPKWFGLTEGVGFGSLDRDGDWQPAFIEVRPADVELVEEKKYRFTPKDGVAVERIPAAFVSPAHPEE